MSFLVFLGTHVFFFKVYLFREQTCMHARVWMGVGVEGENPKQTPLSAESDVGLDPTVLR